MTLPNPAIVVPGITATYLRDLYPISPESIWTVMTNEFERIVLHPDAVLKDRPYEARQPARIVPDQIYEVAYKELIAELRHNLTPSYDTPVPVYPFGYDWRKRLDDTEHDLKAFIDEVIERTALLPHYRKDGYNKNGDGRVDLIGHSMGGLIIAGYLQTAGATHRVGKIATLASPFRGSFEAVIKVTTGTANLGGDAPSSREREAARLTPALYHLLPSMDGGLTIADPAFGDSLFDATMWQQSITETLADFVSRCGYTDAQAKAKAPGILQHMLSAAEAHRARIESLDLEACGLSAEDWLCVVGIGSETRVKLAVVKGEDGGPEFDLSSAGRKNAYKDGKAAAERATGDGTVPFEGAIPGFLDIENVLCVTPDDYGYWELQDSLLTKAAGFHGILPNMNMLHRLLVRHLTGRKSSHNNIWGCPAPGITFAKWNPAIDKAELKR